MSVGDFACPNCGTLLRPGPGMTSGMTVRCGGCGGTFALPATVEAAPAAPVDVAPAPPPGADPWSLGDKFAALSNNYTIDINEWFNYAKAHYNAVMGPMIGYIAIHILISILYAIPYVGPLILLFLEPPLAAGYVVVTLAQLKGRPWTFSDFFGGFQWYGQLLANALLLGLIFLGCLLPGAIVLGIAAATENDAVIAGAAIIGLINFCAAMYILVRVGCFCTELIIDRGFGPVEAIQGSWIISRGHFWGLFGVGLLLGLMALGALLFCVVPFLFVAPFVALTSTAGYLLIAGTKKPIAAPVTYVPGSAAAG